MTESQFQAKLIRRIKKLFPGCIVLKNDSGYLQGIPDLSIFWKHHWAMLEVKASADAKRQPNQEFYVDTAKEMSFAALIYPENQEEVLDALQLAFSA